MRLATRHRVVRETLVTAIQEEGYEKSLEDLRRDRIDPMALIISFFSDEG